MIHSRNKITPTMVGRVHGLRLDGIPLKEIARNYGVSYSQLSKAYSKWKKDNDRVDDAVGVRDQSWRDNDS